MERLRFSSREIARAEHLVAVHMDLIPPESSDAAVRRWIRRVGEEHLWDLYRIHLADWWGNPVRAERPPAELVELYRRARAALAAEHALKREDLAISGDDLIALGMDPGPAVGEVLGRLLERVLEDPSVNRRERLLELAREERAGV
jgi:hypothetical protein